MKDNKLYTRSTKLSLKFANRQKKEELSNIFDLYQELVQKFVNYFWLEDLDHLPKFCDSETYKKINSDMGAYLRQCAGKQALSIIKGTYQKQKQRIYVYEKLKSEGKYKRAEKLKKVIDSVSTTCPEIKNSEIELGGNCAVVRFEDSEKSFDSFLYLSLSKEFLNKSFLPLKKTKHFNKMIQNNGKLASGCRISKDYVTFTFKFEKKIKENGETLGIDIGSKNVISCSNGFQSSFGLDDIQKKLARKKKGSKAFGRAQEERKNFVNRSVNCLNLINIHTVKRENIKNMKKGVRTSRFLTAWTYTNIFDKLDRYCEEQNVSVIKISPTYTSQRCSVCGWTRKKNRKGKTFKCTECDFTSDADLNASKNIYLNLREIGKKERLFQKNKIGFYWLERGQELIVPDVTKNKR